MIHYPNLRFFLIVSASIIAFATAAFAQTGKTVAPQFRTITVVSEPAAIVRLDGVGWGKTDKSGRLDIKTVSVGSHTLRLSADGFQEKSQAITPSQKGEIRVALLKTNDEAELAYQEGGRLSSADREKSADSFRRAIKLRPNYPEAYLALARVLSETGDLDEALGALSKARKLRLNYAEAAAVEGRIHKDNGDEDRAISSFKRAIAEGKGFQPEAYTGLGLLFKEKAEGFGGSGDFANEDTTYATAGNYLKLALKQLSGAPDAVVIYQLLGLIYERSKNYKAAIAIYEEFLRLYPNNAEATAVRSFIVQLKKDLASQE